VVRIGGELTVVHTGCEKGEKKLFKEEGGRMGQLIRRGGETAPRVREKGV